MISVLRDSLHAMQVPTHTTEYVELHCEGEMTRNVVFFAVGDFLELN